jgi:hypothetical protein
MGLLESVLNDPATQQRVQDFIGRYDHGAPADGIGDQEALEHHQQLAAAASPQEYQQAAQDAFARLGTEDRAQLGQQFQGAAASRGLNLQNLLGGSLGSLSEPGALAQVAGALQRQQPGLLGELLGGGSPGGGSTLASPAVRAALGGIAAMLAKRALGSNR